jgi:hypothetical protein
MAYQMYDVVQTPKGNQYMILSGLQMLYLGNVDPMESRDVTLLTLDVSELKGSERIGKISYAEDDGKSSLMVTMTELMILLDCARGSIPSDDDNFQHDSSDREDVFQNIEKRLGNIRLGINKASLS